MNQIAKILPVSNIVVDLDASSKKRAFEQAGLLFENNEDAHITRTSNLSFSTSFAAAVFASPSKIWVCLLFCGR